MTALTHASHVNLRSHWLRVLACQIGILTAASQGIVKCKGNNVFTIRCKHLINIRGEKNLFEMIVAYATLTLA